jgi:hypothetical protein
MPLHHEAIMRANRPDLSIAGVFMEVSEPVVAPHPSHWQTSSGSGDRTLTILVFVVIVFGNLATTYTNRERQRMFLLVHADGSWIFNGRSAIASTLAARGSWQHWSLHCTCTLSESRYSIVSRSPSEKMRIWC